MNKAPDAFRTISEVAADLDLPQHVLRFWESRFPQIKPMKRGGGRRYYRPDDVELLRGIRHLLYGQGYTIRGVQRILREQGPRFVQTVWQEGAPQPERQPEVEADERGSGRVQPARQQRPHQEIRPAGLGLELGQAEAVVHPADTQGSAPGEALVPEQMVWVKPWKGTRDTLVPAGVLGAR